MGSTPEEQAWAIAEMKKVCSDPGAWAPISLEGPQHRVQISRAFYLGVYDVTQEEYEKVMGVNPSAFSAKPLDPARLHPPLDQRDLEVRARRSNWVAPGTDTRRYPVDSVTWSDATAFCARLSALPAEQARRARYRLPTEAQWEYACRAGTTTAWYSGSDPEQALRAGWFYNNLGHPAHAVGELTPNAWGLYDMHGSCCQWCADSYDPEYYAHSPVVDPPGSQKGSGNHFYRGAQRNEPVFRGRSASRNYGNRMSGRFALTSFRVLLELPSVATKG